MTTGDSSEALHESTESGDAGAADRRRCCAICGTCRHKRHFHRAVSIATLDLAGVPGRSSLVCELCEKADLGRGVPVERTTARHPFAKGATP